MLPLQRLTAAAFVASITASTAEPRMDSSRVVASFPYGQQDALRHTSAVSTCQRRADVQLSLAAAEPVPMLI